MRRKVHFVWEIILAGWRWEATHYEGNGIFFGRVKSPYVPEGELGTWYYWEIVNNGAVLVEGDANQLKILLSAKSAQKAMTYQQAVMGGDTIENIKQVGKKLFKG